MYNNIDNKNKILEKLFDYPTKKFHLREISRMTHLNPNTIITITKILEKEGLIEKEKKRHMVEVSAILEEKFRILKRLSNLRRLYECGIINFLKKALSAEDISVIGSYSMGEDIEGSDIDLVVISREKAREINLGKFERILSRKIQLIVTDYSSISEEFYLNLINGIVLYGYLDKKIR